jgi:hypothetical protein
MSSAGGRAGGGAGAPGGWGVGGCVCAERGRGVGVRGGLGSGLAGQGWGGAGDPRERSPGARAPTPARPKRRTGAAGGPPQLKSNAAPASDAPGAGLRSPRQAAGGGGAAGRGGAPSSGLGAAAVARRPPGAPHAQSGECRPAARILPRVPAAPRPPAPRFAPRRPLDPRDRVLRVLIGERAVTEAKLLIQGPGPRGARGGRHVGRSLRVPARQPGRARRRWVRRRRGTRLPRGRGARGPAAAAAAPGRIGARAAAAPRSRRERRFVRCCEPRRRPLLDRLG